MRLKHIELKRTEIVFFAALFAATAAITALLLYSRGRTPPPETPKSLEPPEIHVTTKVENTQSDDVTVDPAADPSDAGQQDARVVNSLPRLAPKTPTRHLYMDLDMEEGEDLSKYAIPLPPAQPQPEPPHTVFGKSAVLLATENDVVVKSGPGDDYATVMSLSLGQRIEVHGASEDEEWFIGTVLPGMQVGYVNYLFVMPEPEASETSIEYYALDVIETVRGKESWLVDVRRYIPDIEYVMIFSTPDNFTGVPLYSRDACMLQKGTVEKLMRAQELFALDGYTIKIYDAYRPSMVSGMLYGIIQDTTYIARAGTSTHNRAAAIDITLVDVETGKELLMPSPMHTFNITSSRGFWGMPSEARANMNYMTSVMVRCGFTTLSTEWWHFNDSDKLKYPPLDYPISAFAYEAVDLEALDDEDADGDGSDATQPTDGDGADGDWFGDGWFGAGDAGDNDAKPEDRDEWFGEGGTEAG